MTDGINRRRFLAVLGTAGGGAAALGACGFGPEPVEKLIPYLIPPDDQIPGTATYYATTCRECPAGCGLHVRVREGRAVKLEGNPRSPINRGRLCARGQAGLQGLYNPDRVRAPLARGADGRLAPVTWEQALDTLRSRLRDARGRGIAFVTAHEPTAFGDLVDEWAQAVGARHVTYEPFAFEALREGNRRAFGTAAIPSYDFARARHVVSFGADFLDTWLSSVEWQNGFARARTESDTGAKLVYVGPRMPVTLEQARAAKESAKGLLAALPGVVGVGITKIGEDYALKVNLLLNRASPEADIDSWIPYEGKARIRLKKDQPNVKIRVPRWTDNAQVVCEVNGKPLETAWGAENYVKFSELKAGDEITLQFPMKEWDIESKIKMAAGQRIAFAREGASVVVADLIGESAEAVASGIRAAGGAAEAVAIDVGDPADAQRLVGAAVTADHQIIGVVHDLGVQPVTRPVVVRTGGRCVAAATAGPGDGRRADGGDDQQDAGQPVGGTDAGRIGQRREPQ